MPKKKEDMSKEEREKMLIRLAEMRQKVAENRKAKNEASGGEKPKHDMFGEGKLEVKKPAPPKPKQKDDLVLEKLDKVASHLEELAGYKKEKLAAKKQKEQQEEKVKEAVKPTAPHPATPVATFEFPKSMGNRFFQGGRF